MPLSAAVGHFYEDKKRLPANLDELVQAGFIKAVPEPQVGKRFVLDRSSMQVPCSSSVAGGLLHAWPAFPKN
jgi:hypothetical protein